MNRCTTIATLMMLAATTSCVHEVESGDGDAAPLFMAEGKDLIDQLDLDADGYRLTPAIPAGASFSRIGLRFDAIGPVAVDARVSEDGGSTFGAWQPSVSSFHEERANNAFVDVGSDNATHLQLRFAAPVESELSFLAVDAFIPTAADDDGAAEVDASASTSSQALAADNITVSRAQWGARTRSCSGGHAPSRMTIHHTETPTNDSMSPAARMRQMQSYHVDVRGWCDIGYHFVVGGDGNIYVGRRESIVGAHVSGENTNNLGIAFMGNFQTAAPSTTMMNAAARMMGAAANQYGITLDRTRVRSHRELGQTDCPGAQLQNRLGDLVLLARNGSGTAPPAPPPPAPPPPSPSTPSAVHAGIDKGTASIPRAGLANDTLRNTLGVNTEPFGSVVTHQGASYVQGTVSWFGGPNDTGVSSTETGAITGERLRSLNSPTNASTATIASRPGDFYFAAMRWDYTPHGVAFWRNARILVVNPANGKAVVVRPVDWGPNTSTDRILDVSPRTLTDLVATTDDELLVAFAADGAALGVTTVGAGTTPPPPPPPAGSCTWLPASGGVIDDGDDCFVLGGPSQFLHALEGPGHDGDYVWTGTTDHASAVNFAEWNVRVPAGRFLVEAFVSTNLTSGTTRAAYQVHHAGAVDTVVVSQSTSGWQRIGTFDFSSANGQKVRVGDNTGDPGEKRLAIDAVRLTPDSGTAPTCARVEIVSDGSSVNVRGSANTSSTVLTQLDDGDVADRLATVTGESVAGTNEWHRVLAGTVTGYVSGAFAVCTD